MRIDNNSLEGCVTIQDNLFDNECYRRLCRFTKNDIMDCEYREKIFAKVRENGKGMSVWALLGRNGGGEWVCLQVASSIKIVQEIIADIKCMLPLDEKDTKQWRSRFHENVFEVYYGWDVRCQKYRNMFSRFDEFCVIAIVPEIYLDKVDVGEYKASTYTEVKFAFDTKALYWNPIKEEYRILEQLENRKMK